MMSTAEIIILTLWSIAMAVYMYLLYKRRMRECRELEERLELAFRLLTSQYEEGDEN